MERYLIAAGDHDKFLFDESRSETYCYEQIKLFYFFNFINRQTVKNPALKLYDEIDDRRLLNLCAEKVLQREKCFQTLVYLLHSKWAVKTYPESKINDCKKRTRFTSSL